MLDLVEILRNKLKICPFLWAYSISLSIFAQLVVIKSDSLYSNSGMEFFVFWCLVASAITQAL